MKKRFLSLCLALVMCVGLAIPAHAAAVSTKAGVNLTPAEQKIYKVLENAVMEVAEGKRTDTRVTVEFEPGELSWTAEELGVSSIDEEHAYAPADEKAGELVSNAWYCLKLNYPFERFWAGPECRWLLQAEYTENSVQAAGLNCFIPVDSAYRGEDGENDLIADPNKIARGRAAAENARAIVQANAGKSDYEKLVAYKDAICARNSYNDDAAAALDKDPFVYGDPWQLVYVFDGDPSTNALCEGYAKAFKYLCDLSEFSGDVTCYLVEGHEHGGAHMWNVVWIDGAFYPADITYIDTGAPDSLFLAGASGSGREYTISAGNEQYTYIYREDNEGLFTDGYLPLSPTAYSPENSAKPQPVPEFTDLPTWCDDEAVWAAQQKITNGYGAKDKFAPGLDCTQAQILTFLWRAKKRPSSTATVFSDLPGDYAPAANWAYEEGIIGDSFNPNAPCTRAQAVTYIWKAQNEPDAKEAASFSDVEPDSPIAPAVSWAVEKRVTKGYGGADTFAPSRVCSRGEIVCFLYRAFHN